MSKEPVFGHTGHKKLWNWLAKNPTKNKDGYPGFGEGRPQASCYACAYVLDCGTHCKDCPFGDFGLWRCLDGIFHAWLVASVEHRPKLAKKIANLPLRDDWKWEDES